MKDWLFAGAISLVAAVAAALAFGAWKNSDFVDGQSDRLTMEGTFTNGFYDQGRDSDGQFKGIEDVGFMALPDKHVTAVRKLDGRVIFDASYTTGPDGFRVVPRAENAQRCVLLFGDSFTFGEGVNDDETTAAQIVTRSKGQVEVKNLGIGGWGPHQFLSGLQSGRFQRAISCKPTDAVYLMIGAHTARAAGRGKWDRFGPMFVVDEKGRAVRAGNFNTVGKSWRELVGFNRLTEEEEEELSATILIEARRELERLYPGIRFHVFLWDGVPDGVARRLKDKGVRAHTIRQIIPDYSDEKYLIAPPFEYHPTPAAYERVAEYLLTLVK
jgi:hypothetical protein